MREQMRRARQRAVMKGNIFGLRHGFCSKKNTSPEYRAWSAMKTRCLNPKSESYKHYGARGITICRRWLAFENFITDVGRRPTRRHSLDRYPDNDGNYEPGNVRWATKRQQAQNRRSTIFVKIGEKRVPVIEVCRRRRMNRNVVWMRMSRGETPEQAIARSTRAYRRASSCG